MLMRWKFANKHGYFLLFIVVLTIKLNYVYTKDGFSQISNDQMKLNSCIPYAYGDFNSDKLVDIYCVSEAGTKIEIWLAEPEDKNVLFSQFKTIKLNDSIVLNLVASDFDGDSVIDLLVVYKSTVTNEIKMTTYFGNKLEKRKNDISEENEMKKSYDLVFTDEPLAFDANGDGIMDLFGEDASSSAASRQFYLFNTNRNITILPQSSNYKLFEGFSNLVTDFNKDYLPDLFITSKDTNSKVQYEQWVNKEGSYEKGKTLNLPQNVEIVGQSIAADFDNDGVFEYLLPACKDKECVNSTIFVNKDDKWIELQIDFSGYKFQKINKIIDYDQRSNGNYPIHVKYGDYNLDSYIDLLLIMLDSNSKATAVLLQNVGCKGSDKNPCTFSRSFKIDTNANKLSSMSNVVMASFFDLSDDGSLDVILVVNDQPTSKIPSDYKVYAFKNEMYDDVYFLKVMVTPGRCDLSTCPYRSLPYGLAYGTPFVRIELETFEYKTCRSYASQMSQSAHFSLQLPFVLFGLGSTANFVDKLTVGIQANHSGLTKPAFREWTSIIPNSQLVISVNPRDNTQRWKMQLFLTPSKNILLTGVCIGSTMICLTVVVIFLQVRERKIDEKERKLESQRFNFDGL